MLQSEMTDHLGAAPEQHTDGRHGYCNGNYERELTTRVGISLNEHSVWRLVGAPCAKQYEEWSTGRCYFTMDEFYRWKAAHTDAGERLPIAA